MGAGLKFDHQPLLAAGRHYLDLSELQRIGVYAFAERAKRERLYYALEELVQRFLREGIPCEMWIDGSFLTEKPEPDDIDVAVKIDLDVSENLNASQRLLVDDANEAEYIQGIDSFVFVSYPRGHDLYGSDLDERETWAEQFGMEHAQVWCKGLAVLRLGETSVGLRIRR